MRVVIVVEGMSIHLRGEGGILTILYSQYISKGGLVKGSNCLENDIRWGPNAPDATFCANSICKN